MPHITPNHLHHSKYINYNTTNYLQIREVERTTGADAWTEHVTGESHGEAGEKGTDEGGDSGSANVGLGEIEVLPNDLEKWRD